MAEVKPYRLVEPFAGLGTYSLHAIAMQPRIGGRSKPPYSRMGSKAGFAPSVSMAWGLSRRPLAGVWLNDTCTVCQALWLSYASADFRDMVSAKISAMVPCRLCQPEMVEAALRGEVKPTPETVMGRDGCGECSGSGARDARLWWEELRSAPVPAFGVELGAVGAFLQARSFSQTPVTPWNGQHPWGMMREGSISTCTFNPEWREGPGAMLDRPALASRFSSLPSGVADFAAVGAFLQSRSFSLKAVGVDGGGWVEHGFLPEHRTPDAAGQFGGAFHPRHAVATNFSSLPGPHNIPITMTGIDAAEVLPDGDASDVVIILDPPYENTSGYANDSPRAAVLALARAWKEAGALVIIHEAVGLADALGAGWEERPAGVLRGKASNFWKGGEEREWITASDPPTWWPAQQMGLF